MHIVGFRDIYATQIGKVVGVLLGLLLVFAFNVLFQHSTYAAAARWDGDNLIYGKKYEPTGFNSINGEVWAYINDKNPLGVDKPADDWTYYEWKENSSCQDAIAFPPGVDPKKATQAYWLQVDSTFPRGCKVVSSTVITISQEAPPPQPPGNGAVNDPKEVKKCDAQWLGWVVCWVSRFIGYLVDGAFTMLEKLMVLPPIDRSSPGGQRLYEIWQTFRNIANVVFIIIFLIIIISQVSSSGISNYGIKRLLPRMIVGVILINASFWICVILVDLSNILGNSLYAVLKEGIADRYIGPVDIGLGSIGSIVGLGLVAAAGVALYMNILALPPLLISALFAIFTTVVVLVVRQALAIIFIAIAPLAFALNILPSTQSWFSKWWTAFLTVLMVYPIIAVVFGGSQVLAGVVAAATPDNAGGQIKVTFALFCLAVQVIPFFFAPIIIKVSGGLINRITGLVDNPSKGLFDRTKNRVGEWSGNVEKKRETNALAKGGRGVYSTLKQRSNRKNQVAKSHEGQLKDPSKGVFGAYVADHGDGIAKRIARNTSDKGLLGRGVDRLNDIRQGGDGASQLDINTAPFDQIRVNLDIENVDAGEAMLENEGYTLADIKESVASGVGKNGQQLTPDEVNAARQRLAREGDLDDIHSLMNSVSQEANDAQARAAIVRGIQKNPASKSAAHLNSINLNAFESGSFGGSSGAPGQPSDVVGQMYAMTARNGMYNAETLSGQSTKSLAGLAQYSHLLSGDQRQRIRESRNTINSKQKYYGRLTKSGKSHLDSI